MSARVIQVRIHETNEWVHVTLRVGATITDAVELSEISADGASSVCKQLLNSVPQLNRDELRLVADQLARYVVEHPISTPSP